MLKKEGEEMHWEFGYKDKNAKCIMPLLLLLKRQGVNEWRTVLRKMMSAVPDNRECSMMVKYDVEKDRYSVTFPQYGENSTEELADEPVVIRGDTMRAGIERIKDILTYIPEGNFTVSLVPAKANEVGKENAGKHYKMEITKITPLGKQLILCNELVPDIRGIKHYEKRQHRYLGIIQSFLSTLRRILNELKS